MLYFHLNMTNFIDPMINGEENNIGIIETFFFNEVFSSLSDAKAYTGSWSEDPPFTDVAVLMDSTHKEHFRNMVGNRMMQ